MLAALLGCSEEQAPLLLDAADQLRQQTVGPNVHLRALIEFSNHCRKDCAYCGIRRSNRNLVRYRMEPDVIVATAIQARHLGYRTVVLQSGEDPWFTAARMEQLVRSIKRETGMAITLSVGERPADEYACWRQAGADRFLLRIETTDRELFRSLHPDDDFDTRARCVASLREAGYQLGSGVMVGLPGQTVQMLARDVLWLRNERVQMLGVGPFIADPNTPLGNCASGTVQQTLKLLAVLRLVFPWAHIPATTAMGSLDPAGREKALRAGANVIMPNVTPMHYRGGYAIYPNKVNMGEDGISQKQRAIDRVLSIGRTVATDEGHVLQAPADW
jgi:biotin synthase